MTQTMAVVTGATGTLGSILVKSLADRGISVLAVSRSGAAVGAGEVRALAADLGDDASIQAITAALPDGELAIAVHAIGLPASSGVDAVDPSMLALAVDLKAGGFLRLVRAVDSRIATNSRLVAVGGHLGIEPSEHAPLAGVANAALANLVRQLVGPIGRRGASVHLAAPGPFASDRVDALIEAKAVGAGVSTDEMRARMLAEYAHGQMPEAAQVSWAITTLLDPAASVLHGSTLFLDGGVRRGIF